MRKNLKLVISALCILAFICSCGRNSSSSGTGGNAPTYAAEIVGVNVNGVSSTPTSTNTKAAAIMSVMSTSTTTLAGQGPTTDVKTYTASIHASTVTWSTCWDASQYVYNCGSLSPAECCVKNTGVSLAFCSLTSTLTCPSLAVDVEIKNTSSTPINPMLIVQWTPPNAVYEYSYENSIYDLVGPLGVTIQPGETYSQSIGLTNRATPYLMPQRDGTYAIGDYTDSPILAYIYPLPSDYDPHSTTYFCEKLSDTHCQQGAGNPTYFNFINTNNALAIGVEQFTP